MSDFAFMPYSFKVITESARKAEAQIMGNSLAKLDARFAALQHRACRGEI